MNKNALLPHAGIPYQEEYKGKKSSGIVNSPFLNSIYNDVEKYKKFKTAIDEMVIEKCKKNTEENFQNYTLPLGFPRPMLLSDGEEKIIGNAILEMARAVNERKYIIRDKFSLVRITCSDRNQRDVPMPFIELTISCPKIQAPKHGFYLSGVFQKEKVMREIVSARIDKITYQTEDMKKVDLMTF